ncbi:MAG: hypothetical protein H7641_03350, partial [Candidatus Heimdallarchaeota archaeon]|nr:hypothetical protein [Candidatus Heimdallarchaeota archaeon]
MATITIEKEKKQYNPGIQQEVLRKYKSAGRWFWSFFQRQPLMYGFATILL